MCTPTKQVNQREASGKERPREDADGVTAFAAALKVVLQVRAARAGAMVGECPLQDARSDVPRESQAEPNSFDCYVIAPKTANVSS